MKKLLEDVEVLVDAEYERAQERFGPINNGGDHQSYGVIKEEVEEVAEDFTQMNLALERFWDDVKCDNIKTAKKDKLATLYKYASLLACEAIQVAAMAYKAQVTIDALNVPDLQKGGPNE